MPTRAARRLAGLAVSKYSSSFSIDPVAAQGPVSVSSATMNLLCISVSTTMPRWKTGTPTHIAAHCCSRSLPGSARSLSSPLVCSRAAQLGLVPAYLHRAVESAAVSSGNSQRLPNWMAIVKYPVDDLGLDVNVLDTEGQMPRCFLSGMQAKPP